MRRLAFTIREDALEDVLDALLPLLPQGVHSAPAAGGTLELAVYAPGGEGPPLAELEAAIGPSLLASGEEEAPDEADERRVRYLRRHAVAGRILVRPSNGPPPDPGVLDVVIDSPDGAFGSGGHPTTRMCLELLLAIPPRGAFADLGCGAGVLAITAALRGFAPVFAVDHEIGGVGATRRNAERNGVEVEALCADLREIPVPPAPTLAANIPIALHADLAARLPDEVEHVIVSGIVQDHLAPVLEGYGRAGLAPAEERIGPGWVAVRLERRG
jgi:ribosomal protein L11 methyltransferase